MRWTNRVPPRQRTIPRERRSGPGGTSRRCCSSRVTANARSARRLRKQRLKPKKPKKKQPRDTRSSAKRRWTRPSLSPSPNPRRSRRTLGRKPRAPVCTNERRRRGWRRTRRGGRRTLCWPRHLPTKSQMRKKPLERRRCPRPLPACTTTTRPRRRSSSGGRRSSRCTSARVSRAKPRPNAVSNPPRRFMRGRRRRSRREPRF